jgi:hypothetical protein
VSGETKPPTVVQALAAVMGHVQAVRKDDKNTRQGFSFRGVDAVVNAVGPALRQEGVIVLPEVIHADFGAVEVGRNRTRMQECRLEMRYTFHGPAGDTLVCSTVGVAMDAGDKAAPKAHSVAYRTALLEALCIPTDEPDPDATTYERAPGRAVAEAKRELMELAHLGGATDPKKLAAAVWKQATPAGDRVDDDEWAALTEALSAELAALTEAQLAAEDGDENRYGSNDGPDGDEPTEAES